MLCSSFSYFIFILPFRYFQQDHQRTHRHSGDCGSTYNAMCNAVHFIRETIKLAQRISLIYFHIFRQNVFEHFFFSYFIFLWFHYCCGSVHVALLQIERKTNNESFSQHISSTLFSEIIIYFNILIECTKTDGEDLILFQFFVFEEF